MKLLFEQMSTERHRRFFTYSHLTGLFVIAGRAVGTIIAKTIVPIHRFFGSRNRIVLETFVTQKPYAHISIIPKIKDAVKYVIGYYVHDWIDLVRNTKIENMNYNNYRLV